MNAGKDESRPDFLLLAPDLRHVILLNRCPKAFDRDLVNIMVKGWLKGWSRDLLWKAKQNDCTAVSPRTGVGGLYLTDVRR